MNAPPEAAADWSTRRVDRHTIDLLYGRRLLSPAARAHALELVDPPRHWGLWAARILTVFGVSLILAGLVYFFAFNWERIPPQAKLAGIALLLVAAAAPTVVLGLDHAVGRIATVVATVLVGVFLAVFGQIYQTGADAWGLFAVWAALTLPWALLADCSATWAVWLVVANVAIRLWWAQVRPEDDAWFVGSSLSIILFDAAFLLAREWLAGAGVAWAAQRWTRWLLLVPILGAATVCSIGWIFHRHGTTGLDGLGAAVSVGAILGAVAVYRWVLRDVAALTLAVMAACVVIVMAGFELMYRLSPGADIGIFLIGGLFTLGVFAAAVAWLRHAARDPEARHE